jgi:hypothetical protein
MKRRFRDCVLVMGLVGLAACSAKVSGGGGDVVPQSSPEVFQHKIAGPDVEGTWASACLFDSYKTKYKQMSIQFIGQSIKRSASLFDDEQCAQVFKKIEDVGTFRWVSPTSYGGFLMDYRLEAGNGVIGITGEELLLEGDVMYLSDFRMGFGSIDRTYPMKKGGAAGSATPAPQPKPAPGPNPAPTPAPVQCADFRGTFFQGGYYSAIDQKECKELAWQALYTDLSPNGQPTVYNMDGQPHVVGGKTIKSYFKESSFFIEFRENSDEIAIEFKMMSPNATTCEGYSTGRPTLMRKGKINGVNSSSYCRIWEKIK